MAMFSVLQLMLVGFFAQAHGKDPVLSHNYNMDDAQDRLIDRVFQTPRLYDANLDNTTLFYKAALENAMRGKSSGGWAKWTTWRHAPLTPQQQRMKIAQPSDHHDFVKDKHAVDPYGGFGSDAGQLITKTVNPTAWTPHAIFPYALPKSQNSAASARSRARGYASAHPQKSVHRRRFTYSTHYAPILAESLDAKDDEEDEEMMAAVAEATQEAAKQMLQTDSVVGGPLAADVAAEAAEKAKARIKAARRAATLKSIMGEALLEAEAPPTPTASAKFERMP